MSELRKEIQQATKRKVTPYIWEYLEGDVIDSFLDAVIAALPTKLQIPEEGRTPIRGGWYKKGWNDNLDEVKSILLEAKEK